MKYPFWRLLDPSVRLELRLPHDPAAPPQGEVLDLSKRSLQDLYLSNQREKGVSFPVGWAFRQFLLWSWLPWTVGFPHTASEQDV